MNPFHEENYVLHWRPKGEGAGAAEQKWRERMLNTYDECEAVGGERLKVFLDGLPEQTTVSVRLSAVNIWGRSEWSEEAEAETLAKPTEDGGSTGPLGPAGEGRCYKWSQSSNEVGIKVPISAERRGKDIKFKVTASRLDIRGAVPEGQSDEILIGPLPKRVKVDEANWVIEETEEDGRHIAVQLVKAEQMEKWPCLIEASGHPRIDTRLVRFFGQGMGGFGGMGGLDIYD